jgi:hypothetical protein
MREQFVDARRRMRVDAQEHVFEILDGIDVARFASGDQRVA